MRGMVSRFFSQDIPERFKRRVYNKKRLFGIIAVCTYRLSVYSFSAEASPRLIAWYFLFVISMAVRHMTSVMRSVTG